MLSRVVLMRVSLLSRVVPENVASSILKQNTGIAKGFHRVSFLGKHSIDGTLTSRVSLELPRSPLRWSLCLGDNSTNALFQRASCNLVFSFNPACWCFFHDMGHSHGQMVSGSCGVGQLPIVYPSGELGPQDLESCRSKPFLRECNSTLFNPLIVQCVPRGHHLRLARGFPRRGFHHGEDEEDRRVREYRPHMGMMGFFM